MLTRTLQMYRSEMDRYLIETLDQETWIEGIRYLLAPTTWKGAPGRITWRGSGVGLTVRALSADRPGRAEADPVSRELINYVFGLLQSARTAADSRAVANDLRKKWT